MFGRPPLRRARWHSLTRVTTTLLTAVALLATTAMTAQAADEPPDGELPPLTCPTFNGDPTAADEFEAYQLALACNRNVEVLSLRDIDRQAFATPAGLLDTQIAVEPYWVQNSAGAWVDIDPTLGARPDGSAQAAATVIRIETGAGGTAPFVTATDPDGGVLSLTWPKGPLPKPVISGAVATFPNVLPDVDLAVQAEAVGFSWVLVVKTPEAAENPELKTIRVGITTVGLTVVEDAESGRIDVLDANGDVVFEAGQGIMWDSSPAGATARKANAASADPGRIGDVDVQKTGAGLTLVPDTKMLADPNLKFPLYIDPPFTSTRKAWANVFQGRPSQGWTGDSSWPRSGGMRVGNDTWSTCGDGCGLWRSAIKLDIGKLKGKFIASASVNMLQTHTGGCGDQGLQLWRTGEISNGTSWKNINWWYGAPLQSKTVPSSNTTGCSGKSDEWVEFDGANIKKRVQSAAANKDSTITFGVRSSNESSKDAWRRIKSTSVKLHVTYYIYPPHPDRLTVDGTGCDPTESGSPWINERFPTFSSRVRTSESDSVYWRFRVRKVASEANYFYYRTPAPVAASTQSRKSTTSLPDGPYKWQARSDSRQSDAVNSGYTNYCYFRVDATVPRVPEVTGPTGAVTEGSSVTMNILGSDPTVNGSSSGLNRYEYSWNTDTFDQRLPGANSARLSRPVVAAGRHVLYIRAVDNAGNKSKHKVFTFFAGRNIPKTPMAAWPLGSDLVDDTSHGKNMSVLTGDPAFAADPVDPANSAVEFDGNDCLKAPTAIRTDAAFTVALSVRMDAMNSTGLSKVLAQGNTSHSMYQVQHNAADNTWSFSLLDAPGDTYAWKSITVPNPVALGKWLRIVATYDPDAGLSRIYLNGALAGEKAVSFTPWNAIGFFSLGCLPTSSGTGAAHAFTGAVDNVGVWQGLMTPTEITNGAKLPYGEIAHWDLRGDGTDSSGFGRDLTLPASAEQSFDPFGRPDGALVLDGQSCATTSTPIIPSDTPFGIGAWVKPGQVTGARQVLFSQADSAGDGFAMMITADGKWELGALSQIGLAAMGTRSAGGTYVPPKAGWQYVEFQYHGDGKWTAGVDGREGVTWTRGLPGRADAPLTIGCHDKGQGRKDYFKGLIHDVQVWRGVKPTASLKESAPAEVASWWSLEETGLDESGKGRNLTFSRTPQYNDGWWDNPDSALELDGTNYAATTTPVVNTDESFTVGAWVRLDALDVHQTIVAAAGANATALRLRYSPTYQRFEFGMAAQDTADSTTHWTSGGPAPAVGTWYFVVGSYNLRTKMMRIYVNGDEVGSTTGPASPWKAAGPLVIGAHDTTTGTPSHYLKGRIDDVVVWHSTVSAKAVGNMFGTNETVVS